MANTKITNHIVDSTVITGQSAVTVADGDYILVSDASDSNALKKVLASDLIQSSEEISDIVGAMVSSNTESGITVAYEDSDNTLDFTIGTLNQNTTGSAATLTTARTIHGVSFDGSANIDLSEVISDTVGAMFSSNTETNITVTYQDSDNTIDLVVDAAQPNITSLGTLTSLTVDDITLDSSTISDGGDLTIDSGGNIVLDADGGGVYFKDDGTTIGFLQNDGGDFRMVSSVSDKDIKFLGNDGGSTITALTLDMSAAGAATFNSTIAGKTFAMNNGSSHTVCTITAATDSSASLRLINDAQNWDVNCQTNDNFAVYDQTNSQTPLTIEKTTGMTIVEKSSRIAQVALTSSSNAVAWDAKAAANAYHVTTENTTFSAPSNAVEGAIISVEIAQGGTARTIAWNTVFEFAASTAPTITATANKTDILAFRYNGSVWQEIGRVQNMAQT
jgi:hypothetical protein